MALSSMILVNDGNANYDLIKYDIVEYNFSQLWHCPNKSLVNYDFVTYYFSQLCQSL